MKKLMEKVKNSKVFGKVLGGMLMVQSFVLGCPMVVRADTGGDAATTNALADTKLVKGFINLMYDAGKVLIILEVVVAGVLWGVEWFKLQQADDSEKPKHKKNIKTIVITAAIIVSGSGLLTAILGYFQ